MTKALITWGGWDGHQPDKIAAFFAEELRAAGLLDSRPMPGATPADAEEEAVTGQSELFED